MKIYRLLFELTTSKSWDDYFKIIDEILSPTEKVMLAKRLTIIYLIIKDFDQTAISEILGVSRSTVAFYTWKYGEHETVLANKIKSLIRKEKVLDFIDDVITEVLFKPGYKHGSYRLYQSHLREKENRKATGL